MSRQGERIKLVLIECWASIRSSDRKYAMICVNKNLDTTYSMTLKIKDTLVVMHYCDITNNAPIGAPYNGTTGIVDHRRQDSSVGKDNRNKDPRSAARDLFFPECRQRF